MRIVVGWGLEVPLIIRGTAKRILAARKRCATWARTGKAGADAQPKDLAHFIWELENMCVLVEHEPVGSISVPRRESSLESSDTAHASSGRQSDTGAAEPKKDKEKKKKSKKGKKVKSITYEIEEIDSEEDIGYSLSFFKLFCLFDDLHNIRSFISQSVREYLDDKIGLMSCAVVADIALHVSKGLIAEAYAARPQQEDKSGLQRHMYRMIRYCRGEELALTTQTVLSDVAKWCFLLTKSLLSAFCGLKSAGDGPLSAHLALVQRYVASADRLSMSADAQGVEDEGILFTLLAKHSIFEGHDNLLAVQDEVSKAINQFFKSNQTVLPASFACQILLDVHHALRYSNQKAYNDFKVYGLRLSKIIDEY